MRRRPLISLAASGLAGTAAGLCFHPSLAGLFLANMALWLFLMAGLFIRPIRPMQNWAISAGLIVLTGGLAALSAGLASQPVSPADLRLVIPSSVKLPLPVEITGTVTGDPIPLQKGNAWGYRFQVAAETLQTSPRDPAITVRGLVGVTWFNPRQVPPPAYGERWRIRGKLDTRHSPTLTAGSFGAHFITRDHGNPLRQFAEKQRRAASRMLASGIADHPDASGLLQALMLGIRLRLPEKVRQDFTTTGTFHVVAISGMHVGMIAWLLASVLRLGGISRVWWFPILAPLLILYTLGTGASASALRACIMACLFYAAALFDRKADGWNALAGAALLILAWNPWQVLDRGFILSFCLVGGLLLTTPFITRATPGFLKPDPFIAPDLIPAWKQACYGCARGTWTTLLLSTAAWLTSLPLTAYFFGRISLIALVANLIAIPASFLIVLAGCFSLVFGSLWGALADIFNYANLAIITVLIKALDLLADIPLASVNVPRPPQWVLPLWYGMLFLLAFTLNRRIRSATEPHEDMPPEKG